MTYNRAKQIWLWALAALGFAVVTSAFLYGVLFRPEAIREAMTNPVALA